MTVFTTDPQPLAAFQLGYTGVAIRMWWEVYWDVPWVEGSEDSVPYATEIISNRIVGIVDLVSRFLIEELSLQLKKCRDLQRYAHNILWNKNTRPEVLEAMKDRGEVLLDRIRDLLDQAIPDRHRLRPLYDLGVALGNVEIYLYRIRGEPQEDYLDHLDLSSVVLAGACIPPRILQLCPSLQRLLELGPLLTRSVPTDLAKESMQHFLGLEIENDTCYDACDEEIDLLEESIGNTRKEVEDAIKSAGDLDWEENSTIEKREIGVIAPHATPSDHTVREQRSSNDDNSQSQDGAAQASPYSDLSPESDKGQPDSGGRDEGPHPKPRWDRVRGELYFGSVLARKVRGSAKNLMRLLDKFEKSNWPECIEDPFDEKVRDHVPNPDRLKESVRSMNENIKIIKFHAHKRAMKISWSRSDKQD